MVELGHFAAGMGEFLGEFAIVGKKQQTCSVLIETTHGEDAFRAGVTHQFHHGDATLGVVGGGDVAFRLVEQQVTEFLTVEGLASVHHFITGFYLEAHGGDHLAVHGDAASLDELVGFTARAHA